MVHRKVESDRGLVPTYGSRFLSEPIPKYRMPDGSMPANVAYQLCHDELQLDGNPSLNLASFVSTWMEPEAEKLIVESLNKNLVDRDEYPQTLEIERRCVSMLAHLYHGTDEAMGTSTIGSSEAVMLAALSHKRRWQQLGRTGHPNIVMGANIQVVWEKFSVFFEVDAKIIPMQPGQYTLTAAQVAEAVDENTICVVAVLGNTLTGDYDPVEEINDTLVQVKETKGWDIPLHIDAAGGGFVAPFIHPDFKWDFRLSQVASINVSGHKYGLVYPGVGWVLWRSHKLVPQELVFSINYLGGEQPTFNLNFSKGGSHVVAQYYNLIRLGKQGYTQIMTNLTKTRDYLAELMDRELGCEILTRPTHSLPLLAMTFKQEHPFTLFDVSAFLRTRGWMVPAYTLPPEADHIAVLRIVVRESFSRDMAELLVRDIKDAVKHLYEVNGTYAPITPDHKRHSIHC